MTVKMGEEKREDWEKEEKSGALTPALSHQNGRGRKMKTTPLRSRLVMKNPEGYSGFDELLI